MKSGSSGRAAGLVALIGIGTGAALVAGLHVLEPQVNPVRRTISEYALLDSAWVFNTAVLAIALGSLVVLVGLVRARLARPGSLATVALAAWSLGLAGVVLFPKHNWARGPSISGDVHRMLSLVAFVSLPLAALALGWAWRRGRWAGPARVTLGLGTLSVLAFLPIPLAVLVASATDRRWWTVIPLGGVERALALAEVAALAAMAVWVIRTGGEDPEPNRATTAPVRGQKT